MKKFIAVILTILFSIPFGFVIWISLDVRSKMIGGFHPGINGLLMVAAIAATTVVAWVLFKTLIRKRHDSALYVLLALIMLALAFTAIVRSSPIGILVNLLLALIVGTITLLSIYNRKRSL